MNTQTQPKIMIIEDDPDLGPLFAEIFEEIGYVTSVITDGALAYESIISMSPDVVILDMHLPHVSGLEILQQVRADPRLRNTRIVVASANVALVEKSMTLADVALLKPIGYDALVNAAQTPIQQH